MPNLTAEDIQRWGKEREGLSGARALHLFKELVEEGCIALTKPLGHGSQRLPWLVASPQLLTKKGLLEIGELPDPDQELIRAFREARERIRHDPNIPEPQKRSWLEWVDRGITLLDAGTKLGDLLLKQFPSAGH